MTARALLALGLILAAYSPLRADDDLSKALLAVLHAQGDAMSKGSFDDFLKTVHSQSPAYATGMKPMRDIMAKFKLHNEVTDFKVIGTDGDYAFARCTQKTSKVSGPEFRDNVRDVLEVFRKEAGVWKEWTSALLSTRYLDNPSSEK